MIQGKNNSKFSESSPKIPGKSSVPPKFHQKTKTLPEKTKFTLQFNTVNSQTKWNQMKNGDQNGVKLVTSQGSRILRYSRARLTVPGGEDVEEQTVLHQRLGRSEMKQSRLSHERKISSLPFFKTPLTDSKSSMSSMRKSTKMSIATNSSSTSGSGLLPPRTIPRLQPCTHPNCKAEEKGNRGRVDSLNVSITSRSGVKLKVPEKSTKSMNAVCKMSTHRYPTKIPVTEVETAKPEYETRNNILRRARRKPVEEEGMVNGKERSRSQEVQRITYEESLAILEEISQKKRSEGGKTLFNASEKNSSIAGLNEKNWNAENVAADSLTKALPFPVSSRDGPSVAKENEIATTKVTFVEDESITKKSNEISVTDDESNNPEEIFHNYQSNPIEDHGFYESGENERRDEELLNLDKRIWSNLEVEIKETLEKTDFLYDSGDDSCESISDVIHQLFSNREDELIQSFQTSEIRKCLNYREDWKSLAAESKSKSELGRRFPQNVESRKNEFFDKPKSRSAIEDNLNKKTIQESKRTKSSEDSKISREEFRTKSLSGDIQLRKDLQEKTPKERKTVNFQDDSKIESKCVASNFFGTHKNVGFIGENVDEEYLSFEPELVTLYQPPESQMLLYDIANCVATQGYLKMCAVTCNVAIRKNAEQMSPSGRVPFISSNLCIIPEFEAIVSFMHYKKFACTSVKESDQTVFRAIISMIGDVLEMSERYICWYDNATLVNYTKPRIQSQYPFPLNYIMHWKKRRDERCRLSERGFHRKSLEVMLEEVNLCFRCLSHRLGNKSFFFGNVGTEVDALVYGHVYALFAADVDGPLREFQSLIQQYPNLVSFACNFDKTFSLDKFSSHQQSYWNNLVTNFKVPSETSFTVKV